MSALMELSLLLLQWPLLPPLLLMVRIVMAVELLSTHLQRCPALLGPKQRREGKARKKRARSMKRAPPAATRTKRKRENKHD